MKYLQPIIYVFVALVIVISVFMTIPNPVELPARIPGSDGRAAHPAGESAGELVFQLDNLQELTALPEHISESTGVSENWPWFRGNNHDAIWQNDSYELITDYTEPLECLWNIEMGEGYAGATVYNGIVYVLDYNAKDQRDVLRAINLADGSDIWNLSYNVKIKRDHGMSRPVPAVNDKYVVTIGPRCQVMCANRLTGEKLWHMDLVKQYETKIPLWHGSQCPLLDGNTVLIAPSGTKLMIAVDCATGKILWETDNPDKWNMTHSSIQPVNIDGVKTYVYCGDGGIAGFDAVSGRRLWVNYDWKMRTNVPTPVDIGDGRLFLCAGYNKGCAMLRVYRTLNNESDNTSEKSGGMVLESVKNNPGEDALSEQENGTVASVSTGLKVSYAAEMIFMHPASIFGAVQHTPVFYNGYIYGIRQDKVFCCLDLDGNIVWESPKDDPYGDSPFMIVNDKLVALDDDGVLSLIDLTPSGYKLIARQQVLYGRESWGLMAMVDGLLIVRDFTEMRCLRIANHK